MDYRPLTKLPGSVMVAHENLGLGVEVLPQNSFIVDRTFLKVFCGIPPVQIYATSTIM